jgi:hypothetical protein
MKRKTERKKEKKKEGRKEKIVQLLAVVGYVEPR